MRYAGFFLILVIIIVFIIWMTVRDTNKTAKYQPKNPKSLETRAMRQLDKVNNDPMMISDSSWIKETDNIIKEYYGD